MKLIQEIIDALSDDSSQLENALLKTKILLHKIGEKSLVTWVNNELNGYYDSSQLPEYRIISSRVMGTATDGYTTRWNNHPIPIAHLDQELKDSLQVTKLNQSIAAIEYLVRSESDTLARPLPAEFCSLLSEGLAPGVFCEKAHVEISKNQFIQVLTQTRSRLLDFVLELSERIPSDMTEEEVKSKSKEIDASSLFNNAIFGDNATVVVGNSNEQHISNLSVRGDFNKLSESLKEKNVSDEDIQALKSAIDDDEGKVDSKKKTYGPGVKSWIKKMMGKAIDTTWKINLGAASSVLASAINTYYGWS